MIKKILFGIVLVAGVAYGVFQVFGTQILSHTLSGALGVPVKVKRVHLSLFPTELGIYGLRFKNPPGFKEPVMISMPEVYVRLNLKTLFQKTLTIERVVFSMDQAVVEKTAAGKINLHEFLKLSRREAPPAKAPEPGKAPEQAPQKPKAKTPAIRVDILEAEMSLRKVLFVDYGTGTRTEKVMDFNIERTVLKNVTDVDSVAEQIVVLILKRMGMQVLGLQFDKMAEGLSQTAGDLLNDAKQTISNIFN